MDGRRYGKNDQDIKGLSMDYDPDYGEHLKEPLKPAPDRPSPETEAMGQMLMEAINREVAIRAQLIEARRRLAHEET